MFVRAKTRYKDGKQHRYWSVVENRRDRDGRVVQRQVLHLGEINDSQRAAWCRSIEVLDGDAQSRQMALFASDREAPELSCEVVRVQVAEVSVHRRCVGPYSASGDAEVPYPVPDAHSKIAGSMSRPYAIAMVWQGVRCRRRGCGLHKDPFGRWCRDGG